MFRTITGCLFIILIATLHSAFAQSSSALNPVPNIYLDCNSCDVTYIRTNVTFVNYVRDQDDASVYLRISDLRTAGGGVEYTMVFSEINSESARQDTLKYVSSSTDSGDERRRGMVRTLKIGLIPFVSNTVAIHDLDVFYNEPDELETEEESDEIDDPWNNWVFDVEARSWFDGQKSNQDFTLYSGIFAERITEKWKIRTRVRGETEREKVELSQGTSISHRNWGEYWGLYAYSLTDRLSLGLYTKTNFNTYGNIKFNIEASPAIEYNLFPYTEYSERRILITYQVTPAYRNYFETTVLNKDREYLVHQSLSVNLRYDRRWGRFSTNISGSNFLHDTSLNRVNFNTSLNFRIVRGFSVSFSGRYSLINDQISLKQGELTDEERLLGNHQQPTSYSYGLSVGFSYTFGSIYNNVINPRF